MDALLNVKLSPPGVKVEDDERRRTCMANRVSYSAGAMLSGELFFKGQVKDALH